VAITMLPTPRHVEQVLLGPAGLLDGLPAGAVWIDMSTSVPAVADRVLAAAALSPRAPPASARGRRWMMKPVATVSLPRISTTTRQGAGYDR
jgi:hypothetical protein